MSGAPFGPRAREAFDESPFSFLERPRTRKGRTPEEMTRPTASMSDEERDTRWLIEHYPELVSRYPMSWIAVKDAQVVGHGATPGRAMDDARRSMRPGDTGRPHVYFLERAADHLLEH